VPHSRSYVDSKFTCPTPHTNGTADLRDGLGDPLHVWCGRAHIATDSRYCFRFPDFPRSREWRGSKSRFWVRKSPRSGVSEARIKWKCRLAQPAEYDWTVYVWRRCGLFVRLLWPLVSGSYKIFPKFFVAPFIDSNIWTKQYHAVCKMVYVLVLTICKYCAS